MERDARSSAARAVSDVLGGHGLTRPRKQSKPVIPAVAPVFHYSAAAMGPAPFVSPRQQLQPPANAPTTPARRSGLHSPPRHTALAMDEPPLNGGVATPPRLRAPPLSVDTSPGPHRTPQQLSPAESPTGRRRMPSSATRGHQSPQRTSTPQTAAAAFPLPSAAVLSSAFLRRKPQQQPPPPLSTHESGFAPASPQVYFFQDTDSDTASQRPHSDQGRDATDSSTSQGSTADDSTDKSHEPAEAATASSRDHHHRHQRARSQRVPSCNQHHALGIEKLGELSRDEEAYDFAILLKPSKVEEHVEMASVSTIHGLDGDAEHVGSPVEEASTPQPHGSTTTPYKLPDTPRALLYRQRHDPASARAQLLQRITATGLEVKRLRSLDGRQTLLKVRAPQRLLELGAERLRLRKPRQFDRIWMEFACELRETFLDFDATRGGVQFLDSEKQSIVHALLTSDTATGGAGLNEVCPLKAKHVLEMFPLHKHDALVALRTLWVTYWSAADDSQHSESQCTRLVTHALHQPLDAIAQYYGERIAFYFAWLELYTQWLVVPSVAGTILFILQVHAKTLDHPLASLYAIFMALWTSAFLLAWKRRAAALAYKWGTLGYEEAECTRPEFYGDPGYSTSDTKVYPAWKRYGKYMGTVPLVITSIALVLVLTFAAFVTRDRLEAQSIAAKAQATNVAKDIAKDLAHGLTLANFKKLSALGMDWDFWFYFLITPILYGLLIPVLDYAFTKIARRLTNWENHQTESAYQSHLILKVFSFRFVHVFASLYYYAFNNSTTSGSSSLLRLAVQLASFMVSDQLWRNAMQTLYPFLMRRVHVQRKKHATNMQFHQSTVFQSHRLSRPRRDTTSTPNPAAAAGRHATTNAVIHEQCVRLEQASDHAWEEAELEPYDTFEDYTEMLIQFGYVTFFSLAFPLAPLLALVNNLFEMRIDAFKLCHAKQRPLAQKASGIGVWFHVLQLMSVLAVLTNCLHMAFTTTLLERLLPGVTPTHKVWIVFAVEHALLALKVWMMVVVPSTPSAVKAQVRSERDHAKIESARAMAATIQRQQHETNESEKKKNEELRSEEGVRRRSRGASGSAHGDEHGVRSAQAVLEAA